LSTRKSKRRKRAAIFQGSIYPLSCGFGSGDPELIHYDVRFTCHRTGKEYCYEHTHPSNCCRPVGMEIAQENEEVARVYVLSLPKCPLCGFPLPPSLAEEHRALCMKRYVQGFKPRREQTTLFIPERNLSYKKTEELEIPDKKRIVKFVEEP